MSRIRLLPLAGAIVLIVSCSTPGAKDAASPAKEAPVAYFKVDPATAGVLTGTIQFRGRKPARQAIDMSSEPACAEAHPGGSYDESVSVNPRGGLVNVFVYIKSGMEGKKFEAPPAAVTIDQNGCGFRPRVMGIQTGQKLAVTNSDPVTHNIHPLAQVNREWNHSQGAGDAPLGRKFLKPEIMIRVKCNIHGWMRAYIGAVEHPYFAVSGQDGSFEIRNIPPGDYVVAAWHETLGAQEQRITLTPSGRIKADFAFKGE